MGEANFYYFICLNNPSALKLVMVFIFLISPPRTGALE